MEKSATGETPLMGAASVGVLENAKLWCETAGRQVLNATDSSGATAFLLAAINGHLSVISYLLSLEEIEPDRADMLRKTPLARAIELDHTEIVELLLSSGKCNVHEKSVFIAALEKENIPMMRRLVEEFHFDINGRAKDEPKQGRPNAGNAEAETKEGRVNHVTFLGWALGGRHKEAVKYLLSVPGRKLGIRSVDEWGHKDLPDFAKMAFTENSALELVEEYDEVWTPKPRRYVQ
jgi:hypothetical protein